MHYERHETKLLVARHHIYVYFQKIKRKWKCTRHHIQLIIQFGFTFSCFNWFLLLTKTRRHILRVLHSNPSSSSICLLCFGFGHHIRFLCLTSNSSGTTSTCDFSLLFDCDMLFHWYLILSNIFYFKFSWHK
jgi:hypothetical protein